MYENNKRIATGSSRRGEIFSKENNIWMEICQALLSAQYYSQYHMIRFKQCSWQCKSLSEMFWCLNHTINHTNCLLEMIRAISVQVGCTPNKVRSCMGGYTAEIEQPLLFCSSGCYDLDLCFEAYTSLC